LPSATTLPPSTTAIPFVSTAATNPNTPETTAVATQAASGSGPTGPSAAAPPSSSSGLAYTGSDSLWVGMPGLALLAVGEVGRRVLCRRRKPYEAPAT
jgi:hypothetical protein